jgi:hypothetical protein
MFRLVVTVRRGTASNLPGSWEQYGSIEEARTAGAQLMRHERVIRIAVTRTDDPAGFVEWLHP